MSQNAQARTFQRTQQPVRHLGRLHVEPGMKRPDDEIELGEDFVVHVQASVGEDVHLDPREKGEAFEAPLQIARYIAKKGSVTVDGVSLTVNGVEHATFEVNIIPHTRAVTTLRNLAPGARVNLEVDMLARYVERLLEK